MVGALFGIKYSSLSAVFTEGRSKRVSRDSEKKLGSHNPSKPKSSVTTDDEELIFTR